MLTKTAKLDIFHFEYCLFRKYIALQVLFLRFCHFCTSAKSGKLDKRTKLTDLWHDLFRVNKCTFATYIFTTFKKLYTIYTETFDKLLYSEYLQCKIIFLNCSATKHDPITQKYHHYCFLDPWKFASCKSTH